MDSLTTINHGAGDYNLQWELVNLAASSPLNESEQPFSSFSDFTTQPLH
jgi:hypothetical protein